MARPGFMSESDWKLVLQYSNNFTNEPYLIAAIGWHETHWFTIGAGPGGWGLGFGYWLGSPYKDKYKGIVAQLKGANKMLVEHYNRPISQSNTTDFAVNHWKSSVPTAWAKSVYSIYVGLIGDNIPVNTDTEVSDIANRLEELEKRVQIDIDTKIVDLTKRVSFAEMIISFIKEFLIKLGKEF